MERYRDGTNIRAWKKMFNISYELNQSHCLWIMDNYGWLKQKQKKTDNSFSWDLLKNMSNGQNYPNGS